VTEDLVHYIREHRATYTREALTAELVAAGHDTADVEAAWAQLDAEDATAPPATAWAVPDTKPYERGPATVILMLVVALGYLASVAVFVFGNLGGGRYNVVVILYTVAMFAVGAFVLRQMGRASSMGTVVGAFLIAVVLYVGLAGACIAGVLSVGIF
jgi:hypothetical protein